MRGRRRSAPRRAGPTLEGLLDGLAPAEGTDRGLAVVQRAWGPAVGDAIAGAGRPVALRDGTLHVACRDATWAHELHLLEATVIARLAAAGVQGVVGIRARAGEDG